MKVYKNDCIDQKLKDKYSTFLGADEVGIGACAGPVLVCAVTIRDVMKAQSLRVKIKKGARYIEASINDSKIYDPDSEIPILYDAIMESGIVVNHSYGWAHIEEINQLKNIRTAQRLAYDRAIEPIVKDCDIVLTGNMSPNIAVNKPLLCLVNGDQKSISIAVASILAKYTRDNYMRRLHNKFPQYRWNSNKGYRSPAHLKAIKKYGLSPFHRTFYKDCQ